MIPIGNLICLVSTKLLRCILLLLLLRARELLLCVCTGACCHNHLLLEMKIPVHSLEGCSQVCRNFCACIGGHSTQSHVVHGPDRHSSGVTILKAPHLLITGSGRACA